MGLDDHVDSRCGDCESPLIQLGGDWLCPECDEDDGFHLTPDTDDFAL